MGEARKVGRPTKFRPEMEEQVYKLCLLGATDEQIADFFDVAVSTIYNWKNAEPGFLEAQRKGKAEADANVAASLYHRAIGYTHPEEKIFNNGGEIVRADTTKHYPPDTAAAFIWLKNRAGWKDKTQSELSGPNGGPIETTNVGSITEDDARAQLAKIQAKLGQ